MVPYQVLNFDFLHGKGRHKAGKKEENVSAGNSNIYVKIGPERNGLGKICEGFPDNREPLIWLEDPQPVML